MKKPFITALDLEGVLSPEIWLAVAESTGIAELRLTTRDITDYEELMQHRIKILDKNNLKLPYIQRVISNLPLLEGARDFLDKLRQFSQVIILSDTFEEFAKPIMKNLNYPTLFCHCLKIEDGRIAGYYLRQKEQKKCAVAALKGLNFNVFAAGDSYNDIGMLKEADGACLFRAPESIKKEFSQFKSVETYKELMEEIKKFGKI